MTPSAREEIKTMIINLTTIDWNSVSAVMSFLAFVGVLLTLFEMKKERSLSYKPIIVIYNERISVKNDNNGRPLIWDNDLYKSDTFEYPFYYLRLENIGLSNARDISITWEFDIEKIESDFRKYSLDKKYNLFAGHHNEELIYRYKDFGFFVSKKIIEPLQFLKCNEKAFISFPIALFSYFSFLSVLKCIDENDKQIVVKEYLPIKLNISYKDISSKTYETIMNIRISNYVAGKNIDKKDEIVVYGNLNFE